MTVSLRETSVRDPSKILMIGNSFCYMYRHVLYGLAKAAGIECRVCCATAPACTLEQHWTWHEKGEKRCDLTVVDASGESVRKGLGLDECLDAEDAWDGISLQDGEYYYRLYGFSEARAHMEPFLGNLAAYIRERFPAARLFFQQVWAYQVGYYRPNKSPFCVPDPGAQEIMHRDMRALAVEACQNHGLIRIPSGDAWAASRADPRIGDNLCMSDNEHDGELGQYLNACVWFETLFGLSCIGNPFPTPLPRETADALQTAAHQAVVSRAETGDSGH